MQAFGGEGSTVNTPEELSAALAQGITSGKPTLINVVIDENAGTESGRITHLNPQSAAKKKQAS
jgi:oxalyl-CoA decarboxylase